MNDRKKIATASSAEGNGFQLAISRHLLWIGLIVIVMGITIGEVSAVKIPSKAMKYLERFGYLPKKNKRLARYTSDTVNVEALKALQANAGLPITGIYDEATAKKMKQKRCGVPDITRSHSKRRYKRYVTQGSKWPKNILTYKINSYPSSSMKKNEVDAEIARAFDVWANVSSLTIVAQPNAEKVDIDIESGSFEHGDGDPFDGSSGTLAHAYFPLYGGDAHFDNSETWTLNSMRGTNLFQVAAHEFGHSLGLSHSEQHAALMAPWYQGYKPAFRIHPDDEAGIQSLYGQKPKPSKVPRRGPSGKREPPTRPPRGEEPTTSKPSQDDICTSEKFDAMFTSATGQLYAFRGNYVWELTEDGVSNGYPKLISDTWKGLPGNIDAAHTFPNGFTYFFKRSFYRRYKGFTMDSRFPIPINKSFPGIPGHLDAVFEWDRDKIIYFVKGNQFWTLRVIDGLVTAVKDPMLLSTRFKGLPENIDTAVTYGGETHVIKDRIRYTYFEGTHAFSRYPRPLLLPGKDFWSFGCQEWIPSVSHNPRH